MRSALHNASLIVLFDGLLVEHVDLSRLLLAQGLQTCAKPRPPGLALEFDHVVLSEGHMIVVVEVAAVRRLPLGVPALCFLNASISSRRVC
jgi:hypothetical protein